MQLLDLPPSAPPPPTFPDQDLDVVPIEAVRASGGWADETPNPITDCTDGGESDSTQLTACVARRSAGS